MQSAPIDSLVVGQSKLASLMRDTIWAATPMGPVETWLQSVRADDAGRDAWRETSVGPRTASSRRVIGDVGGRRPPHRPRADDGRSDVGRRLAASFRPEVALLDIGLRVMGRL